MAKSATQPENFTQAVTELEQLVTLLRSPGGVPLEEALTHFERGVGLVNYCQQFLKQTGGRLTQLSEGLQLDADNTNAVDDSLNDDD
jgi:exodeoxyribonuclease VII small subunit